MIVHIHRDIRIRLSCLSRQILAPLLLVGLIVCLHVVTAQADSEFTTDPILRLKTDQHTAPVARISIDRQQRFLVSGSYDKTVRVYDIETGQLLQTLRIPIDDGYVGRIHAVTISPDGDTVAVGGWTGKFFGGHFIFLLKRNTGTIIKFIDSLPVILHLAYSPDGRYLVGMFEHGDIKVYETKNYKLYKSVDYYGKDSYWGSFDSSNRLVTTSFDGYIRLYDSDFKLIKKNSAPGGDEPYSAVFSPDGSQIVVGYEDSTRVDVLSADDLSLLFSADTKGVDYGNLDTVAWSTDGHYLYAGGLYSKRTGFPILRWDLGGRDKAKEFYIANNTIVGIVPLNDGRLAVGASDPLVSVLGNNGKAIWKRQGGIADFRSQLGTDAIRLSQTGDIVQFGFKPRGENPARFSLTDSELTLDPPEDKKLLRPITESKVLDITDWEHTKTPRLNGTRLKLKPYETSRSLAISPDGKRFLLGAEWNLYCFDRTGRELWKVNTPGAVLTVNISGDGRLSVAGFGDGTLRWYRMKDGKELLALFALPDGKRWVVWTPDGYYKASAGGEDLIGWHLNNGADKAPDFFGISRFREQFYRPDVIAQVLKTLDVKKAIKLADKARGQETVAYNIQDMLPPVISILSPAASLKQNESKLVLIYEARSSKGEITSVEAKVDGRPATVLDDTRDYDNNRQLVVGQIDIEIPPQNSIVSLIAKNRYGTSEPADYYVNWEGTYDKYKPKLYVLAIGVTDYDDNFYDGLKYCAKDAEDFINVIKKQEGGELYSKVVTELLPDNDATKDAILDKLEWLEKQTTARDVAMLFISGHGVNNPRNGEYYYIPYDAKPTRLKRTTVKGTEIQDYLEGINGKTMLFIDTCFSGNLLEEKADDSTPDIDHFANELADIESGVIVFASSTGRQLSNEDPDWGNGAFTKALIEGIEGQADYTKDWYVYITELEKWVEKRVKDLTNSEQTPVTTKPQAVGDYKVIRVAQ